MTLSTQLRIILLLVGVAVCLAIYLLGRRRNRDANAPIYAEPEFIDLGVIEHTASFEDVTPLDEDELDTPAYMRRQGIREPRQDYEPRIAHADDYRSDDIEVRDDEQYLDDTAYSSHAETQRVDQFDVSADPLQQATYIEPVYVESVGVEPAWVEPAHVEPGIAEIPPEVTLVRREPVVELDDECVDSREPPTMPNIPVMAEPVPVQQSYARPERSTVTGPSLAPTLSMAVPQPVSTGMRETRAEGAKPAAARRKIIALRLPMAERVPGAQLLPLLQGERLQHGKFNIFHRMHEAGTVFSVASMVEPGSFNIDTMPDQEFPGVTLFMLLPGPLDGLVAYDQMMSCAQRLAHATGGVLHDERGSKLTPQAMERLREEVLDFQHLFSGA